MLIARGDEILLYAGGEILVDQQEIVDAGWLHKQNLSPVPSLSIARKIIDWFVAQP